MTNKLEISINKSLGGLGKGILLGVPKFCNVR